MQEISNSLRQRLGARPQPVTHPDPDVLTAYVEQVLPAAERAEVVLHLSECSHCREVVSLSLPQTQPEQVVLQVPSRARFWIPAFRLGAVAAMVVVAATLMIEKPWRTQPIHSVQVADSSQTSQPPTTSQPAQPVPPAANTETPSTPATQTTPSREVVEGRLTESRSVRATVTLEAPAPPKVAQAAPMKLGVAGGVAGGVPQSDTGAVAGLALDRPVASPPAPQPVVPKSAVSDDEQDFVNRGALRQEKSKDKLVATDAASLPAAPSPQESNSQTTAADAKAAFPPVKLGELPTRTDYVPVEPPKTSGATPPSGGDSSLKKSSGFGYTLKSKVEEAVNTVKKAAMMRSGGGSSVSSFSPHRRMASPDLSGAAAADANLPPGPQYRIGPDGILMRSTDYTRWHQAYPAQSSDLQLKVWLARGDQVWAGGSNATLIHSWNGGVNWETMKVPDSGDITSITIDDCWQVKTSNGQTFVSQDHGKTWVPLQAEQK